MPHIIDSPADQGGLTEVEAGLLGENVLQVTHGFSVDDVIFNNNGTWTKAQADSAANAGADDQMAVVAVVTDVDNFTPRFGGKQTSMAHSFTVGDVLYLDASTAGAVTATAPSTSGHVVVPCYEVIDSNTLLVKLLSGSTVE